MNRINIKPNLYDMPCGLTALYYATNGFGNGYISLDQMKKLTELYLSNHNVKYKYFSKKDRKRLCDFDWTGKYIICVLGHYVYMENNIYFSAFDNDNDLIVAYWRID